MARISIVSLLLVIFVSCARESEDNTTVFSTELMELQTPANLPALIEPANNPLTKAGFELGRRLYYDSILDPHHSRACASCHVQQYGFTTPGTNVIPHINLAYNSRFLWNGEVEGTLEDAMVFEVEDFFHTDASKIQKTGDYPYLFLRAFGSTEVTTRKCALALAQFLRANISGNSKFDRYVRHEENLTQDEMSGLLLFFTEKADCFHCHSMSLMTDGSLHNIGLDSVFDGLNSGYYNHSGDTADLGKFKTPSIRNCGIRTSFMHDGRFSTLEEVIEHYNSGVKHSPSLDAIMTKPGKELGLQLTPLQKQQLKAFLLTLTDSTYLNNPLFSSPFH